MSAKVNKKMRSVKKSGKFQEGDKGKGMRGKIVLIVITPSFEQLLLHPVQI
jgi:hypothetical protein